MGLRLQTGPTAPIVEDADLWAHLRVANLGDPAPADQAYIALLRDAVTAHLDGRDGVLGRALIDQTWDYVIDRFPCPAPHGPGWSERLARLDLPLAPLQSVSSITYVDAAGASQPLDSSLFAEKGVGDWAGGYVVPAYGQSWPSTRDFPEAVTVRFVAGFGASASALPAALRAAALLLIAELYEQRAAVTDVAVHMTPAVHALIAPWRRVAF